MEGRSGAVEEGATTRRDERVVFVMNAPRLW